MRNITWGLILITLGTLLLLHNLDIADFGDIVRQYWPLILIIWGLLILIRQKSPSQISSTIHTENIVGELIHESSILGDLNLNIKSKNFKGGSISTVLGDSTIDLSQSVIAEAEHQLIVHAVLGDVTVILPKEAGISVSANTVLGDMNILGKTKDGFFSDLHTTSSNYVSSPNRLRLKISTVFGDIRVIQ